MLCDVLKYIGKNAKITCLDDMTYKSMIIQAMDDVPESILSLVYDFLEFLKSKNKEHPPTSVEAAERCGSSLSDHEGNSVRVVDDLELLSGMLYRPGQSAVSLEDMEAAIAKHVTESDERIRYEYTSSLPNEG